MAQANLVVYINVVIFWFLVHTPDLLIHAKFLEERIIVLLMGLSLSSEDRKFLRNICASNMLN
jgi:hypothetical protein